ncbi:S-layer homology domain-containing protein [Paenibacillus doosanensis]|uniref:RCC1 domain-containing protein n=1 Tax=Paenibacillus doosanensis TaxID=1229154 RepID=UPI00217FF28D|nr:S-layer homology domain-containing protein [Paenibacillus doosanensis]MCS7461684.1 S-layer homology domain-containing protein [Paenibacillus doosanensis]
MVRNHRKNIRSRAPFYMLIAALLMQLWLGTGMALAEDTSAGEPASPAAESSAAQAQTALPSLGIVQVAGGLSHSVALKSDGSVWTWGDSLHGKLGTGPNVFRYAPSQVKELFDIKSISAGMNHTLALRKDGTVWAWGQNDKGQLGDGTTTDRPEPFEIPYLRDVVAISAGGNYSMALKKDGTLVTWGDNSKGQLGLGDSSYTDKLAPNQLAYPTNVLAIAAGSSHALALLDDNSVIAWGDNTYGQLGNAVTETKTDRPTRVNYTYDTKAIAAGSNFSMLLKENGKVWTWGYNSSGQLGNGNTTDRNFAADVLGISDAVAISAGNSHALVLHKDGKVSAWGLNNYGQLGTGDYKESTINLNIDSLKDVVLISAGAFHSFAVKADGTVWAWGNSSLGQLGDGAATSRILPTLMPRFSLLVKPPDPSMEGKYHYENEVRQRALAAGDSFTAVVKNDKLWTWGENIYGQLAQSGSSGHNKPGEAADLSAIAALAAGSGHAAALKSDGTVSGWGLNLSGQLGEEASLGRGTPAALAQWRDVTDVAAGNAFTLALKKDGSVWAVGDNTFGQLGDGTSVSRSAPVQIPGLMRIKAVAAGFNFGLALADDGTVWAWGDNSNGQLGDGTTMMRRSVQQIIGLDGITAIAAGKSHAIALKSDGTVWSWGYNAFGQLGDDTNTNRMHPVQTSGMNKVTAIAGGAFHTLAIRADGMVWSWGYNAFGQLGDNTTTNRNHAVQVQGLGGAVEVAAGSAHSAAITADGTVWTWGGNMSGQLGDGTYKNRTVPAAVTGFVRALSDTAGHWAEAAIASALEKGYADGYPDGTFRPDGAMTRAEFAKMAAAAAAVKTAPAADGEPWYKPYAAALTGAGYYTEDEAAQAAWNEPITRGEIAAIAVRATNADLRKDHTVVTEDFAMQEAVHQGLLQGLDNGRLAPEETTTRAQAVTIIERILAANAGVKR